MSIRHVETVTRRDLRTLAPCAALALGLLSCTNASVSSLPGTIRASLAALPSTVQAVHLTVTGPGITGDVHADMADLGGGNWLGEVTQVPAGIANRTVIAYAYDSLTVPADPVNDDTGLIYKGVVSGVTVTDGGMSFITITLIPYPNGGGGPGINTPPHITAVSFPSSVASNGTAPLSVTAIDPDLNAVLTYTWSDGGAGGTFSGGSGNPAINQVSGVPATVNYQPSPGGAGTVTIGYSVTDGQATVSGSFHLTVTPVGGTVAPTLVFDTGPEITIDSVSSQEVRPGTTATIGWAVTLPVLWLGEATATWTDSCGGSFTPASETHDGGSSFSSTTLYQAPPTAPGSPECDLTLTVTDGAGAQAWSGAVVWVSGFATKVVFVTSTKVDGAYFNGDPNRADALCQDAVASGTGPTRPPAGTYRALVSFDGIDARDRIADGYFVLGDGTPIASSKAVLFSAVNGDPTLVLGHGIDMDENGGTSPGPEVWTGSAPDGTGSLAGNSERCNNWTTNAGGFGGPFGYAGDVRYSDYEWIHGNPDYWCSDLKPVYCFQQ